VKEGISLIKWTPSGKVASVTKTDGSVLSFTYDGMGNRVRKVQTVPGVATTETTYLRDASGNVLATYNKSNSQSETTVEQTLYGSQRLGVRTISLPNNTEGNATVPTAVCYYQPSQKVYELSNHLGNVHAVLYNYKVGIDLNADGIADFYKAKIASLSDYYSFGMNIDARTATDTYRYGFNGMEKDDENFEGAYDFGARIYNSRIGRWLSVDPSAYKYVGWSPYNFVLDNPIKYIDPDGRDPIRAGIKININPTRMSIIHSNSDADNFDKTIYDLELYNNADDGFKKYGAFKNVPLLDHWVNNRVFGKLNIANDFLDLFTSDPTEQWIAAAQSSYYSFQERVGSIDMPTELIERHVKDFGIIGFESEVFWEEKYKIIGWKYFKNDENKRVAITLKYETTQINVELNPYYQKEDNNGVSKNSKYRYVIKTTKLNNDGTAQSIDIKYKNATPRKNNTDL
jgi:RHS repeat-associated protein